MKYSYKYIKIQEQVMRAIFFICGVFSILALVSITVFLFSKGLPFLNKIGIINFLFGKKWTPIATKPLFGILPMIITTFYVAALSVIIGVSVGLLTAICLYKFCKKKMIVPISQMINLLAGIPSVIYGLFGLKLIVPFFRDYVSSSGVGYGIMSASIVLAIMILPTIVSVSYDSLIAVPNTYMEGSLALGATEERTVFKVIVPAAKSGIMTGVVLGIGRSVGETMAVIMVIGGSPEMPKSVFQSVRTMTANIAMGATELSGDALLALIATGVILFVFTFLLNIVFAYFKNK